MWLAVSFFLLVMLVVQLVSQCEKICRYNLNTQIGGPDTDL